MSLANIWFPFPRYILINTSNYNNGNLFEKPAVARFSLKFEMQ